MDLKEKYYPESLYGGFSDIDGTFIFYSRVNSLLNNSFILLDVGCGRGGYQNSVIQFNKSLRMLRGKVYKVIGIDVDNSAMQNPYVDDFQLIKGDVWPIESASVDIIICDFVLEHVEKTDIFWGELSRVLKSGGYLCIRTSNRWSYFAIISRLIPRQYHEKILSIAQPGRKSEDVFKAEYRCNTVYKIRTNLREFGFDAVVYGYESEPAYLNFSQILYGLGVLYQKISPGMFKSTIFAFGIKK